MKRKANITFMVLSIFILLITPLIPHHHHDSAEYIVMDCCPYENDGTTHKSHCDENPLCVKNTSFLEAKHYVSPDTTTNYHSVLRDLYIYQEIPENLYSTSKKFIFQEFISTYCSVQTEHINSLRAPPFYLV